MATKRVRYLALLLPAIIGPAGACFGVTLACRFNPPLAYHCSGEARPVGRLLARRILIWSIGFETTQCHNGVMESLSDSSIEWIVRRYAALLARGRPQPHPPLVLPNGQFFPDDFDGDAGSVNLLFWRLQEHAGLTDLEVELRFVDDREDHGHGGCGAGGCSSGGCSSGGCHGGCGDNCKCRERASALPPVDRLHDAYRVDVLLSRASSPTSLTSFLATALARIHVEKTGGLTEFAASERAGICELHAIGLGFGVLLANASHMFSKSCGGVRVQRATALSVMECCLALALFIGEPGRNVSGFTSFLDPTQRDAYADAKMWVASNQRLVRRLYREPSVVSNETALELRPAQPWLARVFGIGERRRKGDEWDERAFAEFEAAHKKRQHERAREDKVMDPAADELRALVEESLDQLKAVR